MESEPVALGSIDGIAARHGLTAYDAAYLELALRRGIPLATQDEALITPLPRRVSRQRWAGNVRRWHRVIWSEKYTSSVSSFLTN